MKMKALITEGNLGEGKTQALPGETRVLRCLHRVISLIKRKSLPLPCGEPWL